MSGINLAPAFVTSLLEANALIGGFPQLTHDISGLIFLTKTKVYLIARSANKTPLSAASSKIKVPYRYLHYANGNRLIPWRFFRCFLCRALSLALGGKYDQQPA